MPLTIKEELMQRLELTQDEIDDPEILDALLPIARDALTEPERLTLFSRMAKTILRA